ncbi:MAG: phosphatidylglycerol lysyltransferase domain-containing protein [Treponema sp.]|nr:phosphatidylglycerol lysyltransferase domain-containing protein [Treponema sp.]
MTVDTIHDHLKPVTFNDYSVIHEFFKKYPSESCEFNVCNIFSWGLFYKFEYTIFSDRLILFNPYYSYLLAPIGKKISAAELFELYNSFKKVHKDVVILIADEAYIRDEPDVRGYFDIEENENLNDYVYTAENLVKLGGKKLAKKKNLISQFMRLYPGFALKPIEHGDYAEVMEFCYYWRQTHDVEDEYLDIEFEAIKVTLTHWDSLPCEGLKLYVDGKLCAFSIYSPQTADMATIHYEKPDPNVKGAGQVINHETAKLLIKNFTYINREQDMGFEGIRKAKRSYQPLRMIPCYKLKGK